MSIKMLENYLLLRDGELIKQAARRRHSDILDKFDELVEDYSRHAVPTEKTVNGLRMGLILVGITITVPAFLVGIEIGQGLGFKEAITASLTGGFVLFLIGACSGTIAARTHFSTYVILQFAFGISGAKFVSLVIALTSLGWFAVTIVLFADALHNAMLNSFSAELSLQYYLICGSLLMVLTTIFGFKALDRVSLIVVPLLAVFLFFVAWRSLQSIGPEAVMNYSGKGMDYGQAVSAIIGGYIVGMTLLPDLCRYAKQHRDGISGAFIGSFIGYPLVLLLSALPSIATNANDYILVLVELGLGGGGVIMLIPATWTTNANNLYSSSLALSTIFTTTAKWKIVIYIGALGTIIAALGLAQNLIGFLLILGYLVPPIAGIYITDYFIINKKKYSQEQDEKQAGANPVAFAAWLAGSLTGYLATGGSIILSGVPSIDAITAASLLYFLLAKIELTMSRKT
ncbi:MAG: hypothetical protein GKR93_02685 [Gammaproteobacteria bacterium]|nr:hypothetical protein [Gammaproteobacteria bacterium]